MQDERGEADHVPVQVTEWYCQTEFDKDGHLTQRSCNEDLTASIILGPLMLICMLPASAATATGRITYLDANNRQMMLDSNYMYTIGPNVDLSSIAVADRVRLNWEERDGHQVITSVATAPLNSGSSG